MEEVWFDPPRMFLFEMQYLLKVANRFYDSGIDTDGTKTWFGEVETKIRKEYGLPLRPVTRRTIASVIRTREMV